MDHYSAVWLSRELYEERLHKAAQARKILGTPSVQKLPSLLRVLILIFTT